MRIILQRPDRELSKGEADAEPLLGVTALESVGIEIDPRNQKLTRLPSTRLKNTHMKVTRL